MASAKSITIQTGAHEYSNDNLTKYSLMMGGLNVTHDVLSQYDPLITGYHRLFMVRKPMFLVKSNPDKLNKFKHILEYGNTGVSGLQDAQMEFEQIKGGYAGRQFEVAKGATDDTNSFTVKVFEFSGSPIRELLHNWINGISDLQSGLAHYNGLIATGELAYSQANHTAEFIYVVTDRTGMHVEYACQFANCMPKGYKNSQFNSDSPGEHNYVETEIEFTCTKYEGVDINKKAATLLNNYRILVNSLEFFSGITAGSGEKYTINTDTATGYDNTTGEIAKQKNIKYFTEDNTKYNTGSVWKKGGVEAIKVTPSYTSKGAKV